MSFLNAVLAIFVFVIVPGALGAVRLLTFLKAADVGAFSDPIGRSFDRWLAQPPRAHPRK